MLQFQYKSHIFIFYFLFIELDFLFNSCLVLYFFKKDSYTWWSYRRGVREKNIGWRIDYFVVSKSFISKVEDSLIYSDVLGSDHCPIGLIISDSR